MKINPKNPSRKIVLTTTAGFIMILSLLGYSQKTTHKVALTTHSSSKGSFVELTETSQIIDFHVSPGYTIMTFCVKSSLHCLYSDKDLEKFAETHDVKIASITPSKTDDESRVMEAYGLSETTNWRNSPVTHLYKDGNLIETYHGRVDIGKIESQIN